MSARRRKPNETGAKTRRFQRDLAAAEHTYEFDVGSDNDGQRLDAFLAERLPWRSRTQVRASIANGHTTVIPAKNQKNTLLPRPRPAQRLHVGQQVCITLSAADLGAKSTEPEACAETPGSAATTQLQILFDDPHLVAVAKPADTSLYPTRRHPTRSLVERVHSDARIRRRGAAPPSPCHRLDRDTTGVVVFARTLEARAELGRQFEERTVQKTYLAIVRGRPDCKSGSIDAPIGPDDTSSVELKQGIRHDHAGRDAVTHWRVVRRQANSALLELHPETGRQHQLRVHLAHLGHPILGDVLYLGGDAMFLRSLKGQLTEEDLASLGALRLQLHAWKLRIVHPITGRQLDVEAPRNFDREFVHTSVDEPVHPPN